MVAALRCAGVSDNCAGGAPAGIDRSSASNGTAVSSDRGAPREYCPELVDPGPRRVRGRKPGSASEMLDDRIERAVPVIGRALQVNPGVRLMGDFFLQRLDRARFADTSLADHGDDLTLARAGETPALEHQPHFVRPADERQRTGADRGEAALDRRFARARARRARGAQIP